MMFNFLTTDTATSEPNSICGSIVRVILYFDKKYQYKRVYFLYEAYENTFKQGR